jgi:hypothetical protein
MYVAMPGSCPSPPTDLVQLHLLTNSAHSSFRYVPRISSCPTNSLSPLSVRLNHATGNACESVCKGNSYLHQPAEIRTYFFFHDFHDIRATSRGSLARLYVSKVVNKVK